MAFSSSAIAQIDYSSSKHRVLRKALTNQVHQSIENNSIQQIKECKKTEKKPLARRLVEFNNQIHNCSVNSDKLKDLQALTTENLQQPKFELSKPTKVSQSCRVDSNCTEEKVVSQVSTPTFNQLLNLQKSPQQSPDSSTVEETQETIIPPTIEPSVLQPVEPKKEEEQTSTFKRKPLREPSLKLEGVYINQDGDSSARARLTGIYPLTPQSLFGGTLDLTSENNSFDDSRGEGLNINELYFATSLKNLPNLRFVVGQMDLTSYFDRNSFAKDGASHFFNSVFQTNPALSSTGIGSRPGALVNWNATDNIIAKAAVFSSSRQLDDFDLDGFAGEVGVRYGNAIIRGTYSTAKDAGNRDSFAESFGIARVNNQFGPLEDDREESFGLNAEVFIPEYKLGLFGRYGRYENRDLGEGANTYSFGLSFLDLFAPDDRIGLAYGSALSNNSLRQGKQPDVVELFYDVKLLPNLRAGFSVQGRDSFSESVLGIRVKSEFDITPRRSNR
ncbi:MAG: carbohydrate porin [Cyanobacteria bacterium J06649_11]